MLERELGISHVLGQVLARRGLAEPAAARAFLRADERHPPEAFAGIERALELIRRHLGAQSRIVVHGDYDVDGICATAIMLRALRALGAAPAWFLPRRLRDGYGVSLATVERLAARGTALLITVDCGITAVEEVRAATELGLDVLVTDHHASRGDGRLPPCPVLHPAICGYPCPELCGAAVAYKLACALGAPSAEEDLELVALATVADLVPLRGENRRLVREGLAQLARTAKPGLRALMRTSGTEPGQLDAGALGFRLAPRLNAAGRLESAEAGLELLLCQHEHRAAEIAQELERLNAERRAVEQRIAWEAEAQVAELGERAAYVLCGEGWHPGVIGIVASRIAERYHRPAFLLARDERISGAPAQGSARGIPGFDVLGALRAAEPLLLRYGGHRAAAGLTVAPERIGELREALERHAAEMLTPELLHPPEPVDAVLGGSELGIELAEELAALEPHGLGNPRPRLLVPGARFSDVRPLGDGSHARFTVISGGVCAAAVAFGCGGRPAEELEAPLDATFHLERNCFKGVVEPRLRLAHARPCAPAPIAVLAEDGDYLAGALAELEAPLPASEGPLPDLDRLSGFDGPLPGLADPPPLERLDPGGAAAGRVLLDRRGESPLAVLADACAAGPTLAVCADVPRRLPGLAARTGGFALIGAHALERAPATALGYEQLVILDPPTGPLLTRLQRTGSGFTQLAWGEAELRFTRKMHEFEYNLRGPLTAVYGALRERRRSSGAELERLLRGPGAHGRPARLGGRLLRVLCELGLVRVEMEARAAALAPARGKVALERSAAYRAYLRRFEEGMRWLSSASAQAAA
jgi:single-stranded-DNA-specific exonuclease